MAQAYKVGDVVVTTFWEPELPEGSRGAVKAVYDDLVDGVDVEFPSGTFNVLAAGLDLVEHAS